MKYVLVITCLLFLFCLPTLVPAQTVRILTADGEEFKGSVLHETSDTVTLLSSSGIEIKVPRAAIRTISSAQTVRILTADGEEFIGSVLRETADTLILLSSSGIEVAVPRTAIRTIDYRYDSDRKSYGGFWSFGGAFGTPAGLELIVRRNFSREWGLGLAFGYLGSIIGLELDVQRLLGESGSARHSLAFGAGSMVTDRDEWNYFKGAYNLNWGGFHLDLGLSVGSGTFSNPQLMAQIGYVHQFR